MPQETTAQRAGLMGTEKISRLLLRFAGPAILMMLVSSLYNIVDKIFVGQFLGDAGLAGATMAGPIMRIITAFAVLIGAGGNALLALRLGEGRHDQAEQILGTSFTATAVLSLLLTLVIELFTAPILQLFGCDQVTLSYAVPYMRIVGASSFFETMTSGMGMFIRTDGQPRFMMFCSVLGCAINIVLDPILIAVAGWGIQGAAFATALSQCISGCLVLYYFLWSKKSTLRLQARFLKPDWSLTLESVKLGFSSFIQQFLGGLAQSVLYFTLSLYAGAADAVSYSVAVASVGVTTSVGMLFVLPVLGLQTAIQPIIGYNYGAGKYARVLDTLKQGVGLATVLTAIGWVIILVLAPQLCLLFGADDYLDYAAWTMRVYNLLLPMMGLSALGSNFFQSIGKPIRAIVVGMSRQVLFMIPAALLLPLVLGQKGVIWALPVADVFSFTMALLMLISEARRLKAAAPEQFQKT